MYVYGQLTAPKPERKAITVTPITPTRLKNLKYLKRSYNKIS